MLEYLAYKKYKTRQAEKDASPQPVLSNSDERFLSEAMDHAPVVILEGGGGRSGTTTPDSTAAPPEWADQIRNRWTGLKRSVSTRTVDREKPTTTTKDNAKAEEKVKDSKKSKEKEKNTVPTMAVVSDELELTTALDKLDLATEGGRAFSITPATKKLLEEFMLILKDVVNGVPTAYDDLVKFLETSSKQLEETFTSLPSFLQKLIKTLPAKLGTSPELRRVIPAVTALPTLQELVAKPGMLLNILKTVLNVLKTRFPALLGVNVAMSLGLFVVLFMLWYCYKRGREERLKSEAGDLGWENIEMHQQQQQQQPFLAQSAPASSSSSSKKGKGKTRG